MKIYRLNCEVLRLDNVRAIFFENVMADSEESARACVEHYRTTAPAPRSFDVIVEDVYEVGDPAIPPMDEYHPSRWPRAGTKGVVYVQRVSS
jgi:hypothetical protein